MSNTDSSHYFKSIQFEKQNKCKDRTKIFMLTSSNQDEDREAALKYTSVKGYYDKPLTEQHIREIISFFEPS